MANKEQRTSLGWLLNKKGLKVYALIFLLCLPLFEIGVRASHDWGGDFAMYLSQAQNILAGKAQGETGYMYNPAYPTLGPPAYPVGFPMLLAPVMGIWGDSIWVLTAYMAVFLIIWIQLSAGYWRIQEFSVAEVVILAGLMAYSPWILLFKDEVLSDIPFAAILMGMVVAHEKFRARQKLPAWRMLTLMGIMAGFLLSIRMAALPWILAFSAYYFGQLKLYRAKNQHWKNWGRVVFVPTLAFLVYGLLSFVIFKLPAAQGPGYGDILAQEIPAIGSTLLANAANYLRVLEVFFQPANGPWQFASILLRQLAVASILLGALVRFGKPWRLVEYGLLLYLGMLLIYPYRGSGFRFLLPVLPFLLEYGLMGIKAVRVPFRVSYRWGLTIAAVGLVLVYQSSVRKIAGSDAYLQQGP